MTDLKDQTDRTILTVSQLNRTAHQLLADHFFSVLVEGEISNLSIPSSGHWYFSLKDANAQVRCAMFKTQQRRQTIRPENGKQVVIRGQVGLYEPRGDYQLIVDSIENAGDGALLQAFEALKRKLADAGLFDNSHKKPLPTLPQCIGVVTSPTGAAIRDILTILKRRFPAIPVIIYPVSVQGREAQYEIARAIATANTASQCDLLIVGRGGGSLEDLWAFNEETVARAIYASTIPVISAVGHETDFTIADFVADVRAPTPSAAAELATPSRDAWLARFLELESRITRSQQRQFAQHRQRLTWLDNRLQQQHPGQRLRRNAQRLDELETRMRQAMHRKTQNNHSLLETQTARLWRHNPQNKLANFQQNQFFLSQRLVSAMRQRLQKSWQKLTRLSQTLNAISPTATLNRGYALVTVCATGEILRAPEQVKQNDKIDIRLAKGMINGQVIGKIEKGDGTTTDF